MSNHFSRLVLGLAFCLQFGMSAGTAEEVTITSEPVVIAQVGQLYLYDVNAVSSDPLDVIVYMLRDHPPGMTIDSATGLIQWTPAQAGSFRVKIRAQGTSSGSGSGHDDQEYHLNVLGGLPASLRGVVQSAAGVRVPGVRLRLFEVATGRFVFNTHSGPLGEFLFPTINPGSYLLRVMPRDDSPFASQWYDRALRIQDATPIVATESTVVSISVILLLRDTTSFALSGSVRDSSGTPLAGARVTIVRDRHSGDHDGSGLNFGGLDDADREQHLVERVWTDSGGSYRVRLRPRRYILVAEFAGFRAQFWDHRESPAEADRLDLRSDTAGIDFDLLPLPAATGAIAGLITSAVNNAPVQAQLIGFHRMTPRGTFTGFLRHAQTDSAGNYRLAHLRSGFYVVLALPMGQFIPTFYDTSGGTTDFTRAVPVPVTGGMVSGIDIAVRPDTVQGLNRIRGQVLATGAPISGAVVHAVSLHSNDVVGAAVSERDGKYVVAGLKPGPYRLVASRRGYEPTASPLLTVPHNGGNPTTATVSLNLEPVATSVDDREAGSPVSFALLQNYPNPFNPSTTIRFEVGHGAFSGSGARVRLKVFDVLGREVRVLVDGSVESGTYDVIFDAAGLASGVYLYRLEVNGNTRAKRMLVLR